MLRALSRGTYVRGEGRVRAQLLTRRCVLLIVAAPLFGGVYSCHAWGWVGVQPFLVMDVLPRLIIPALYSTVELKMERIVDLGPFKHKARVLLYARAVFL